MYNLKNQKELALEKIAGKSCQEKRTCIQKHIDMSSRTYLIGDREKDVSHKLKGFLCHQNCVHSLFRDVIKGFEQENLHFRKLNVIAK